jgi:hypothetical protein
MTNNAMKRSNHMEKKATLDGLSLPPSSKENKNQSEGPQETIMRKMDPTNTARHLETLTLVRLKP